MKILRLYFFTLLAAPRVISDEDIETIFCFLISCCSSQSYLMRILRLYFFSLLAAPPVISDEDIETIFCLLISCSSSHI